MNRLILTGIASFALVPFVAAPAAAANPNIYHTISSTHASAVVTKTDGCLVTEAWVSSSAAMYASQPGPVNKQDLTGVLVRVTDACATPPGRVQPAAGGGGVVLVEVEGRSMAPLVADPRLRRASVSAALAGTDRDGRPVEITLDATWAGVGPLEHSTVHSQGHYQEGNVSVNDNNLRRAAIASGSVRVAGEDVDLAVTGTDSEAVLERVKSICVEVPRPGVTEFYPCFGFPG